MAGKKIVAVFDFDKTIIDVDSDNWVIDELGFNDLYNRLLPTMPWNSLMDRMMKEIQEQGKKTVDEIVQVLKRVPIDPRIVSAIKSAHDLGCELRIVSDANVLFIETILEHLGLRQYFSEIHTNPGVVDEQEGRLKIFPYHGSDKAPHGCTLCPANMCKGMIIEKMKAAIGREEKKKFIYLGDGAGDYCPSLKLTETDYVMPRKNFPVWELISNNPMLLKAEIHEWNHGGELQDVLLRIVRTVCDHDHDHQLFDSAVISSSDKYCKLQNMAAALFPAQPLSVPQ
ncbi:Inorganic pyrophosphatase 1 [Linum grandiflorum]